MFSVSFTYSKRCTRNNLTGILCSLLKASVELLTAKLWNVAVCSLIFPPTWTSHLNLFNIGRGMNNFLVAALWVKAPLKSENKSHVWAERLWARRVSALYDPISAPIVFRRWPLLSESRFLAHDRGRWGRHWRDCIYCNSSLHGMGICTVAQHTWLVAAGSCGHQWNFHSMNAPIWVCHTSPIVYPLSLTLTSLRFGVEACGSQRTVPTVREGLCCSDHLVAVVLKYSRPLVALRTQIYWIRRSRC